MIERVIENWLVSVNERQYQIPFCQLLATEGETIIHISSHGQLEQGKDVISIARDGVPCAYQLKNGPITLPRWRQMAPEVAELVEYDIKHPGIRSRRSHRPYLVTNGEVNAPAVDAITSANRSWARRRYPTLTLINKGQLLSRFQKAHGSFLPKEPADFRLFLELFLRDGNEPLDKDKTATFLELVLPINPDRRTSARNAGRALASSLLLVSYILRAPEAAKNHWAIFEGWTLCGAYVLATATKYALDPRGWRQSFDLCVLGARRALEALCEECQARAHLVEGNPLADGYFYGERIALLLGMLAALSLFLATRHERCPMEAFISQFIENHLTRARLWGESAVPFLFESALTLARSGRNMLAENFMASIIGTIARINAQKQGRGLPNPYYGPEECVRLIRGLDQNNREEFLKHSYTIEPLIDYLARQQRRVSLARLWEGITRVQFTTFSPSSPWEWLRWRSRAGSLNTRLPATPQSWARLVKGAQSVDVSSVPTILRESPAFIWFFLLVFPHRFQRPLVKVAEDALQASSGSAPRPEVEISTEALPE